MTQLAIGAVSASAFAAETKTSKVVCPVYYYRHILAFIAYGVTSLKQNYRKAQKRHPHIHRQLWRKSLAVSLGFISVKYMYTTNVQLATSSKNPPHPSFLLFLSSLSFLF
jgi:hypothetical protein